jgi:hypothetical protein
MKISCMCTFKNSSRCGDYVYTGAQSYSHSHVSVYIQIKSKFLYCDPDTLINI